MEPDFSKYSLKELKEVEASIDKSQYPERYEKVKDLISGRSISATKSLTQELKEQEKEDDLRELYREYKRQNPKIWKVFRGAILMFVTFRAMQYLEWSTQQQILGGVIVFIAYLSLLIGINEYQFKRFKSNFGKRT
jgi:excinuclease UvrABC nuclease subunit